MQLLQQQTLHPLHGGAATTYYKENLERGGL